MKVAILSESQVDTASARVLVDAVLGVGTEPISLGKLLVRSWPGMLDVIRSVYLGLYYNTDADGLVLIADGDHSPPHAPDHEECGKAVVECRLCQLHQALAEAKAHLKPRPYTMPPLHVAVGLAVPEIAAWYLCGLDPHVNEAAWFNGLRSKKVPYTKVHLKKQAFQAEYVPLKMAILRATDHARRLAADLALLERSFPVGFGSLANGLRSWPRTS